MIPSAATELNPSGYAPYYELYIQHVKHLSVMESLKHDWSTIRKMFVAVDDAQGLHRYAPDKWSIKEVILHCIDSERIFAYRALRFMRGDSTALPGYDHEAYAAVSRADERTMHDLNKEWKSVRLATKSLFSHCDEAELSKHGMANENKVTVRALAYIIAGHNMHHMQILRERYGVEI